MYRQFQLLNSVRDLSLNEYYGSTKRMLMLMLQALVLVISCIILAAPIDPFRHIKSANSSLFPNLLHTLFAFPLAFHV
jgi:hypothetical protein